MNSISAYAVAAPYAECMASKASFHSVKPLPPTPASPDAQSKDSIKLTPSAHEHVRKIIAQSISEEELPTSCVVLVQQVVDEVGEAVWEQDWLYGLRLSKEFRRRRALGFGLGGTSENASGTRTRAQTVGEGPSSTIGAKDLKVSQLVGLGIGLGAGSRSPTPSPRRIRTPRARGVELTELNNRALTHLEQLIATTTPNATTASIFPDEGPELAHLVITLTSTTEDHVGSDPFHVIPRASSSKPQAPKLDFRIGDFGVSDMRADNSRRAFDVCGVETWKSRSTIMCYFWTLSMLTPHLI